MKILKETNIWKNYPACKELTGLTVMCIDSAAVSVYSHVCRDGEHPALLVYESWRGKLVYSKTFIGLPSY